MLTQVLALEPSNEKYPCTKSKLAKRLSERKYEGLYHLRAAANVAATFISQYLMSLLAGR